MLSYLIKTLRVFFSLIFWKQSFAAILDFVIRNVWAIHKLAHCGRDVRIAPSARLGHPERISLGDMSDIGSDVHIYAGANSKITIGKNTLIGPYAFITSDAFSKSRFEMTVPHSGHEADVFIGDNVRVGAHAIILPGVTIGNDISIGAGAVVTEDIPDGKIVVGNPARAIK